MRNRATSARVLILLPLTNPSCFDTLSWTLPCVYGDRETRSRGPWPLRRLNVDVAVKTFDREP